MLLAFVIEISARSKLFMLIVIHSGYCRPYPSTLMIATSFRDTWPPHSLMKWAIIQRIGDLIPCPSSELIRFKNVASTVLNISRSHPHTVSKKTFSNPYTPRNIPFQDFKHRSTFYTSRDNKRRCESTRIPGSDFYPKKKGGGTSTIERYRRSTEYNKNDVHWWRPALDVKKS